MKNMIKRAMMAAVSLIMAAAAYAQNTTEVERMVTEIANKYDEVDGIECMTVTKGNGLEMVKLMFNQQFGKDFMKGVKSITIINYSDAPEATCQAVRNELNAFIALLEEFKVGEEKEFADNDFVRCFASASEGKTISDFVAAIENEDSKMLMYMAGEIKVE